MNMLLRRVLCGWLMVWVMGLPLIHIHPESDHAHGQTGHQHGGTFHTILSGTPICAYEHHRHHHDTFVTSEPVGSSDSPSHPLHGLEHPAYGFSVLKAALDPLVEKMSDGADDDGMHVIFGSDMRPCFSGLPVTTAPGRFVSLFLPSSSSRAPPFSIL